MSDGKVKKLDAAATTTDENDNTTEKIEMKKTERRRGGGEERRGRDEGKELKRRGRGGGSICLWEGFMMGDLLEDRAVYGVPGVL